MAKVALRQTEERGVWLVRLLALLAVSGCAVTPADVTLVNPKTNDSAVCPSELSPGLNGRETMELLSWQSWFEKTQNRSPTVTEWCVEQYEILGYVRKPK